MTRFYVPERRFSNNSTIRPTKLVQFQVPSPSDARSKKKEEIRELDIWIHGERKKKEN